MDVTEGKVKRLRNLPSFKGKSDEEIIEYLKNRPQKERKPRTRKDKSGEAKAVVQSTDYDSRYNAKFSQLQEEFGIDLNDANDAENIRILVRLSIQLEDVDKKINTATQKEYYDTKAVKELGEFQKSLINGITEIQEKLGITRKVRKEKQVDDIPQYLKAIRQKAREKWNRDTTEIVCQKCQIELSRYWLNFPDLASTIKMELECWKCGEKTVYVK